jgi:hypothetical protein
VHSKLILTALMLLEKELIDEIQEVQSIVSQGRAKIILKDVILYIQYNKFREYGYQLVFSEKIDDQARFDNFDKNWDVKTKPHHFHPRNTDKAFSSPMKGEPEKDIPILCQLIKSQEIWSDALRF